MQRYECIILLLFLGMLIVDGANQNKSKVSFDPNDFISKRVYEVIDLVVTRLVDLKGHKGITHYHVEVDIFSISACWFIEAKTLHDYFERDKNGSQLKASLLNRFRWDLDPSILKKLNHQHPLATLLYHDVMDIALHGLSQADPLSLTVFRKLNSGSRISYDLHLGTLRRGATGEPCIYQRALSIFEPEFKTTNLRKGLVLRDIPGGEGTLFYYRLPGDEADYWRLGDKNTHLTAYTGAICFYPLPSQYPSYTFIYSLVGRHPDWENILKYEPWLPQSAIKMLVKRAIQILLRYHKAGVVHNEELLDSVVVPTKMLEMGPEELATNLTGLRLSLFQNAFTTGKYSYDQVHPILYPSDHARPPPEAIDKTLMVTDPTKLDSWYVGLLMLEFHLGYRLFPYWGGLNGPVLQIAYLILFGVPSMAQETVVDKLEGLNYSMHLETLSKELYWCRRGGLKAGQFDLWSVVYEKLGPDVTELVRGLLAYDPKERLGLEDALKHRYFEEMITPVQWDVNSYSNKRYGHYVEWSPVRKWS